MAVSVADVTSDGGRTSSKDVGVEVEAVLAQRPRQRGARAALHGEHRTGDLDGSFVVEDPEFGRRLPVRCPQVFGDGPDRTDRPLDDRVVGVAGTIGCVGMRKVRDPQQQLAKRCGDPVVFDGEHTFVVAELTALGLELLGGGDVAVTAQLADLLGDRVDPGTDRVTATRRCR